MSEYQYIGFLAIDGPVSEKNLEYMRKQSSRAEITEWSFRNTYQYGDFRGDALEMLRRGYDVHLHYADYGITKLMIRLPSGLPNGKLSQKYLLEYGLKFIRDASGLGGILSIDPFYDGHSVSDLIDPEEMLSFLKLLRAELLDGDLRPLYLAHLAVAQDSNHGPDETYEAPVPAGLKSLTQAQQALADFFGLSRPLIEASAIESPPLPDSSRDKTLAQEEDWIRQLPKNLKDTWLLSILRTGSASVRSEMLSQFRCSQGGVVWPTNNPSRTMHQLQELEEQAARKIEEKAAATAARLRQERLAQMASDPAKVLRDIELIVAERTTDGYRRVAALLCDLREAVAATDQAGLAEAQALRLKKKYPTRRSLLKELSSARLFSK
ncbi:hypothetical protein [Schlesneria sp. DSM 10557]|uniref:hypothetical protein n=1 Tax=Schlesneria sp. DSM 10557 TaxID=3044399 RepID=UPI0035A12D41